MLLKSVIAGGQRRTAPAAVLAFSDRHDPGDITGVMHFDLFCFLSL